MPSRGRLDNRLYIAEDTARDVDLDQPRRLDEFIDVVRAAGLSIPAVSTARRSVSDPEFGEE